MTAPAEDTAWRDHARYAALAGLPLTCLAWEFLRRNPDYRRDYAWFMETWQALERDYGRPPQRDFHRWRQDPRAWRAGAAGEDLLIECWMAERWGLARFPLDPTLASHRLEAAPAWHELAVSLQGDGDEDAAAEYRPLLRFDLRAPLEKQMDEARRILMARQRQLRRAARLEPAGAQAGDVLVAYLRLLDAEAGGVSADAAVAALGADHVLPEAAPDDLLARARALRDGDYRFLVMT